MTLSLDALAAMSPDARRMLLIELQARISRADSRRRFWTYYPDAGPLRRELYDKHLEFFEAGLIHDERAFVAANRAGKTHCVSYEATAHLTGEYPRWWVGRRFDRPVTCWACGEDAKAVRESLQEKLLGRAGAHGTGLIPGDSLETVRTRVGVPESVDIVSVRHASGAASRLVFKMYEQGREAFQSAAVDILVFDEEPPLDIYSEGLTRTLSTDPGKPNGMVMCSFTPLKGLSDTVLQFLPGGRYPETVDLRRQAWGW